MKSQYLKYLMIQLVCLAFIMGCQAPDRVSNGKLSQNKVAELDLFLNKLQQAYSVPGIAVAILTNDTVLYRTVGYRDLSAQALLTDSTPFFMGNISEVMTATAAVKLAQSGKINLEDPVVKHLPYFKLADKQNHDVLIKHLLTHTSGVPHHDAVWDLPTFDAEALASTTQSIGLQQPEFNPPGSRVKRSQFNYDILADLIEKASGMRFEDYMNKEILQPLGMKHAAYYATPVSNEVAKPHVISNWLSYALSTQEHYPQNREHAGSIGFHASIKDMTAWMSMLLHEGIYNGQPFLNKDFHQQLMMDHYRTGKETSVGFGWEIKMLENATYYSKTHFIGGFSADMILIPESNTGVLVMSNVSQEFDPSIITDQISRWLAGSPLNSPKPPVNIAMGRVLETSGSLDSALALYTALKNRQADQYDLSHVALSKFGVNLMHRLKRNDDAIKVFDFILKQFPSTPYAHLNMAEAYVVGNNIEKAEEQIKIVKTMMPRDEDAAASHLAYLEEAINIKKEPKHEEHTEDYLSN